MESLWQDLRFGARRLRESPGFTLVVVLLLAIGIGANAAIFSLLDQVILRPLPVRAPEELVLLHDPGPVSGMSTSNKNSPSPLSHPMFVDLRGRDRTFAGLLAYYPTDVNLSAAGETEKISAELVSGSYFEVLGLRPAAGRLLQPGDDTTPAAHPIAVLGYDFWQRRFGGQSGGERSVIGRTLVLNTQPMTVVGVAPAGFRGLEVGRNPDVYVPLMMKAAMTPTWDELDNRRAFWLTLVGRLRPGASREEAQTALNQTFRQIVAEELETYPPGRSERFRKEFLAKQLELQPGARGASGLREQAAAPLWVLMAAAGTVLLITCANVANLLLARATGRQREMAVRLALGAGRGRLMRQLIVESLLLAAAGGAAGCLLSVWGGQLLVRALPEEQRLPIEPDLRLLAFSIAAALVTALLFGLAPTFQTTRASLLPSLRDGGNSAVGSRQAGRFRSALVAAQLALSLLLLFVTLLFTRTLTNLEELDPGFDPQQLLTFQVDPSLNGYDETRKQALFEEARRRLAALPGVRAASFLQQPLLSNSVTSSTVEVEGYEAKEDENMNPHFNTVGPSYFTTLGIPLVAGRAFDARDNATAPKVAVVNQTFARYFYGKADPIGRRFSLGGEDGDRLEIIGVIADAKTASLRDEIARQVYQPVPQVEDLTAMTFYLRAEGDPAALGRAVRQTLREVDPTLPVTDLRTLRAQVARATLGERSLAVLAGLFGGVATLLAVLGLYGVMSYSVARRRREIGVRLALGAQRPRILRLVLGEALRLCAWGLALGLPAGWAVGRVLRTQLFGVDPGEPWAFLAAVLVLTGATLAAAYAPADRAARVDPLSSLKAE
jgi:predicted permease